MESAKAEKEAHGEVESPHPAFLVAQDTCYIGTIKGISRIYQQAGIDTHANVGFAKAYLEKTALTAAALHFLAIIEHAPEFHIELQYLNAPEVGQLRFACAFFR